MTRLYIYYVNTYTLLIIFSHYFSFATTGFGIPFRQRRRETTEVSQKKKAGLFRLRLEYLGRYTTYQRVNRIITCSLFLGLDIYDKYLNFYVSTIGKKGMLKSA